MNGMPNIPSFVQTTAVGFGGAALINGVFGKVWGITNKFGIPIVLADNIIGLSHDSGSSIANFPTEKGQFTSYNKVNKPSIATVQVSKSSGGPLERGLFLTQLETLKKSTLNFNIITPEYVYMNYQIIGNGIARSASDGATLITVNIDLQEVLIATIDYSVEEVQNPADSNTVDGGAKQSSEVENTSVLKGWFG